MTIKEILKITEHRPWVLPSANWKYYQEWNNAVFLHWKVDSDELKKFVPADLDIDLYEGKPWVSLVAFTMEKIRPRNIPAFPPISDFHEINIRTYVSYQNKPGVYFLSIEGGTNISCKLAKRLSELPYRYSAMKREHNNYTCSNFEFNDKLIMEYSVGRKLSKTEHDKWLIERYALFQDTIDSINEFEIHHHEWPIYEIELKHLEVNYSRFKNLLSNLPSKAHYSTGVQVIAWDKKKNKKLSTSSIYP